MAPPVRGMRTAAGRMCRQVVGVRVCRGRCGRGVVGTNGCSDREQGLKGTYEAHIYGRYVGGGHFADYIPCRTCRYKDQRYQRRLVLQSSIACNTLNVVDIDSTNRCMFHLMIVRSDRGSLV